MAAQFLATHGINLQAELDRMQFGTSAPSASELDHQSSASTVPLPLPIPQPLTLIRSVILPHIFDGVPQDIQISSTGHIESIIPTTIGSSFNLSIPGIVISPSSCVCLPSLCHPHIHLDKPHLLSQPKYAHLQAQSGTFGEALSLTSQAKSLFEKDDMLQRANWLISESVAAGVTCMRAFVEVDSTVGLKGVEMGEEVQRLWKGRCDIQLCAFAQDPVFSSAWDSKSSVMAQKSNKELMEEAAAQANVEAIGSTPYVEEDAALARENVKWIIALALRHKKHVDLHLDYHLDPEREPLVWRVVTTLLSLNWLGKNPGKTVCLGHCTRLTLWSQCDWERLAEAIEELPVYFVGLPTSDIFMMGRPGKGEEGTDRGRGTMQILWMIKELGIKAVLGVNNVGNPFTPYGSADPLQMASMGVGVYQAGTKKDATILYECISSRAKEAIGYSPSSSRPSEGDVADLVIFGKSEEKQTSLYRPRTTVQQIVYDAGRERIVVKRGCRIDIE